MKRKKEFIAEPAKDHQILCVDQNRVDLDKYKNQLGETYDLKTAVTLEDGLKILQEDSIDTLLFECNASDSAKDIQKIELIKKSDSSVDIIPVVNEKNPRFIWDAAKAGAANYVVKPFEPEELLVIVERLRQNRQIRERHDALLADLNVEEAEKKILGKDPKFIEVLNKAKRVKGYKANILITGESGTGKEVLARYIHRLEDDKKRPFIAVNCAAIPDNLVESELFGHEKGSFTGATQRKIGKFEMARGGDIFLDEIGSLKPELQAKLLRVIEDKCIFRVGGTAPIKIDFRTLAATNDNLEEMIKSGKFRADLYHRINVVQFKLPALRDRKNDIELLVGHFFLKHNRDAEIKTISADALAILKEYKWPGNIRELENLIHNLIIMAPDNIIEIEDLPPYLFKNAAEFVEFESKCHDENGALSLKEYVAQAEQAYICHVIEMANGNKSKAASLLDISRACLHGKIKN